MARPRNPNRPVKVYRCNHCRYAWVNRKMDDEPPPQRCPNCRRRTWQETPEHRVVRCPQCNHRWRTRVRRPQRCPSCYIYIQWRKKKVPA